MNKEVKKFPKKEERQGILSESSWPKRGEIWIIDYNFKTKQGKEKILEIESSIKKTHPSLVISNNIQNEFDREIIVVPLSSQELDSIEPYELLIKVNSQNGLEKDSKILFNRLRNIDKNTRLKNYIGVVEQEIMKEVKEKLKLVLDLED